MSLGYHAITDGAFDPTVQPLWDLYARHFWAENPDPCGPGEQLLEDALSRVGCGRISIAEDRIALAPGTTITLNGIARGYITDRVTELLKAEGVEHSLVNLGEIRLIGRRLDGRGWLVGLEDPDRPGTTARTLEIENCAVATSGGYGCRFDRAGRFTHLFDPATGKSPQIYKSVSVVSQTATAADALSTAFSSMEPGAIERVLQRIDGTRAYLAASDGRAIPGGENSSIEQR
jgi:FAD:protein FMN transferase